MADSLSTLLQEIMSGDALGMTAAASHFPAFRGEGHADRTTVWKWGVKGSTLPNGVVVKLEIARVGGRWLTSRAAIGRFVAAMTEAAMPTAAETTPQRSPAQTRKAAERANARLLAMGA